MRPTKYVNNISDKLRALIPKLKPGEVKTFVMLNGVPNADPLESERQKHPILYGKTQIRTNLRIYDPYLKDEEGKEAGGYVDIGVVEQWDGDKPTRYRMFVPGMGEYSHFHGKFSLTGGNIQDEELWEILWLSPEREGSMCKDAAIAPLFKVLDPAGDVKGTISKVDTLRKALDLVKAISDEDARKILAALNQPTYQDPELLKAKISEFAKDKPDEFLKMYQDPNTEIKATIRMALDSNVITHDIATGSLMLGKTEIANLKVVTSDDVVESFTQFVNTSANGKDVFNNIKAQIKKSESTPAK